MSRDKSDETSSFVPRERYNGSTMLKHADEITVEGERKGNESACMNLPLLLDKSDKSCKNNTTKRDSMK